MKPNRVESSADQAVTPAPSRIARSDLRTVQTAHNPDRSLKWGLTSVCGSLAVAGCLQAAVIQVDFSDANTNPLPGNWNTLAAINTTDSNLIDFGTGSATSVSVTTADWSVEDFNNSNWTAGLVDWVQGGAARDGFVQGNPSTGATVRFDGLTGGGTFRVEIVSAFRASSTEDISIGGAFADRTFLNGAANGNDFDPLADGTTPGDFLIWDNVTADQTGRITINFDPGQGGGNTRLVVNAIRITEVPEVEHFAGVFGLGLVGFIIARSIHRRRAKSAA